MSKKDNDMGLQETEEILRRLDVALYGVDLSKLSAQERKSVKESTHRRWELEAEAERRNPKPRPILSQAEELELRRFQMLEAKFEKVAKGRPLKELSNNDLEEQLKILQTIVKRSEVK
ncbi:hypothetical protein [Priestia aryabhattai]|uniref:Uncharacterized protein n=1 Tax=Priestia aryabhattai TaxID=412384 RepID=A0ABD7WU07_PRIAR|nr:hypothetical protein [Priestia aryabhattai]WEA43809.1 hypothetical protein PWO00_23740 [Priestia aryabhattai]